MLRPFRGRWLVIPARIIGSWLMVIGVIVTVSLYVPFTRMRRRSSIRACRTAG